MYLMEISSVVSSCRNKTKLLLIKLNKLASIVKYINIVVLKKVFTFTNLNMQAFYVTLSLYFLFKLIHQYCRSQNIQSNIITDARGRATSSAIYKQEYLTFQRKLISSVFINQ